MSFDQTSLDAQLKSSRVISDYVISALATERGAHAETCVCGAGRMAGTILFRTFGLPTQNMTVGSPVLSDIANERGPVLVEVMKAGLAGLGIEIDERTASSGPTDGHAPLITIIETQQKLDEKIGEITSSHGLYGEEAARACALATALLISLTKSVLDPQISFGLAVYGFVEGTKTVPIPSSMTAPPPPAKAKPWYKF
ncbi:MAG: hypothetical protein ABI852_16940 [Gemmatimonadaceae bacterium]